MTGAPTAPGRRLLLVHAHPDDETLATGGTIARYAAAPDTSVTLVTCTLGEQGEVIPPGLAMLEAGQADQLGGYRIGELAGACAALGPVEHRFLGGVGRWRDSGMALAGHGVRAATPEVLHPRALARPEAFDAQVEALAAVLAEVRPQVVVTYPADGGYGHPDHVRAHEITVAAVAAAGRPARLAFTGVSRSALAAGLERISRLPGLPFRLPVADDLPTVADDAVTARIDVTDQRAARVAALRAHATQVEVWAPAPPDDGAVVWALSNGIAQPLLDAEEFTVPDAAPGVLDDLFDGAPA
ncbi:N-acetyl-1-D-myo-inositol-2-amino-2-deoxy-alpha-D-glucopyranoside deacetylase [Pseudonocardia lacus]|uniref:N-acetyl-1-D-myo-inositol-2-amino-2-deoxy-alpha- D-glucopyranoside deacetylase n=1 Tax=Pseudonocardia lacus TaxID=2835865 RepID=UPI0027E36526|nr:N-acetyl-1-D-myo-inositol-2-amino-2-deoxy-alpha-D-glucopyranoside deacetylase [Pseudonocardia lacus]